MVVLHGKLTWAPLEKVPEQNQLKINTLGIPLDCQSFLNRCKSLPRYPKPTLSLLAFGGFHLY